MAASTGVIAAIGSFFSALAGFFGFQTKKLEEKNTAEMKANDKAQKERKSRDHVSTIVKDRDLDRLRRENAE